MLAYTEAMLQRLHLCFLDLRDTHSIQNYITQIFIKKNKIKIKMLKGWTTWKPHPKDYNNVSRIKPP
jgi:hypothetical protein